VRRRDAATATRPPTPARTNPAACTAACHEPIQDRSAGSGLTGAQWAVARAIARGDSDREIAEALHLSVATVHEHVAALHRVLGTSTRPRLVAALAGAGSAG
jgi:DNA-binding NarL/FixJ family response regulator